MAKYLLGYTNSDETLDFAVAVRQGLERAVAEHPDFELVWRDNASDTNRAIAHIAEFTRFPVDLAIIYHFDESLGVKLVAPLKHQRISVISVEHPIPLTTFLGLDDSHLGSMAAEEVGRWVQQYWDGQVDKVVILVDPRRFAGHLKRFAAAVDTLKNYAHFSNDQVLYLDSSPQPTIARERFAVVLNQWQDYHRIVVIAVGDLMAIAALEAARDVDREEDLAVLSGNGLQPALDEFQKPFSRLLVSPAVYPEHYGDYLVSLAARMLNGEKVPPINRVEPVFLSRENLSGIHRS